MVELIVSQVLITYLGVSSNNKSETVIKYFLDAVQKYNLPLRVRSDRGTENSDVANFMVL